MSYYLSGEWGGFARARMVSRSGIVKKQVLPGWGGEARFNSYRP